jgi:hypothetical protein
VYRKFETYIPRNEKLRGLVPSFYNYVTVSDLYIPTIGLFIEGVIFFNDRYSLVLYKDDLCYQRKSEQLECYFS